MSNKAAGKEDAEPALTPKLRFPEFRDAEEWQSIEIGDIFQVTRGDVLSMKLVRESKTAEMPYPVYSSQTKDNGLSGFYSDFLFEDAITWTTDGANAGDVNYRPGKFYCTNVCGVLLNSEGFANPCIAALLNSVSKKYVSYVGNPKLMNGVMSKIRIPIPSVAEQKKIAECLSSVDELIATQARKLDALKTHKKGLMQELFPREGETQPRLRFPEFQNAGEWEKEKLSSVIHLVSGMHLSPGQYGKEGGVPYFTGPSDYTNDNRSITKWTKESTSLAAENDTLITVKGSGVGELWYLTLPTVAIGRQLMAVRANGSSSRYVHQFLLTKRTRFEDLASGNLIPGLSRGDILDLPTAIPALAEQQRIADCLTTLADLITAQTQKLEALKTHKNGLMQQLFPSPEKIYS